ncbi:MAG TPA: ABC transporter permease [Polyangiaceae bacterium]|nr:ABC transporter permease [Polyangiaceae bacterium]
MSELPSLVLTAIILAFSSIRRRPVRALLTSLGILVGIAAVTVVVALGQGASTVVGGAIDALGTNALLIEPRASARSGVRDADKPADLTEDDATALRTEAPSIREVAPLLLSAQQVMSERANAATGIVGTTRDFFAVRAWSPVLGGIWNASAEQTRERVCLLGETVREELFGPEDPIGRTVRIGRFPFKVVGLLSKKGESPFGGDQDDVIVMPLSTLQAKLVRTRPGQVQSILVSARASDSVDTAEREATEILRQRHRLLEDVPNDFEVHSQAEFKRAQTAIVGVLELLLFCIAAVSLAVGGIGVMNIMLVSVAERTREIGIRLAIGARAADVLAQFLVEAVALTALGGVAGALTAVVAIAVLGKVLDLPMHVSPVALGAGLVTSAVTGIVFGFFPARRAAELDPIDALRTE